MKEHPIIFSSEMVRAILDGRKTQTRRIIKPQPFRDEGEKQWVYRYPSRKKECLHFPDATAALKDLCPYGQVGDRLWVRENMLLQREKGTPYYDVLYYADKSHLDNKHELDDFFMGYRGWYDSGLDKQIVPSIHVPKDAARIWLEITNIRVERVQDINYEDAIAEGIGPEEFPCFCSTSDCVKIDNELVCDKYILPKHKGETAQSGFGILWDSLNAKPKPVIENKKVAYYVSYPWEEIRETRNYRGKKWYIYGNPWVWVIEFKRL